MARLVSRGLAARSNDASANSYLALLDSALVAIRHEHELDRRDLLRSAQALGIETKDAANLLETYIASLLACGPTVEQEAILRGLQSLV